MIRKSYLTVLRNQVRSGHVTWPLRQAFKLPALKLGTRIGAPLTGPIHGTFFTTYACNLRCTFCDLPYRHIEYTKAGRTQLTRDEKLAVIDDFAGIGTTAIGFTGGEPMLDPDLPSLITRARERGVLTHLSSNGFACKTIGQTERIFDLGVHGISISIDGTAQTHDAIRGRGSFDKVMTALANLLAVRRRHRNKMSITTTTVITRDNHRDIPEMIDLLIELGVDQIGFMPVSDIGLDYDVSARSRDFMITQHDELDELVDHLLRVKRNTGRIENTIAYLEMFRDAFRGKPLPVRCHAGYVTLGVDSWGDIFPCFPWAEMRRAVENVRDVPLAEFWRSESAAKMRGEAASCRDCFWNNQTELNLMVSSRRDEVVSYQRVVHSQPIPASLVRHIQRGDRR